MHFTVEKLFTVIAAKMQMMTYGMLIRKTSHLYTLLIFRQSLVSSVIESHAVASTPVPYLLILELHLLRPVVAACMPPSWTKFFMLQYDIARAQGTPQDIKLLTVLPAISLAVD